MGFTIPDVPAASFEDQSYLTSADWDILQRGFEAEGVVSGCAVTAQSGMTVDVASGTVFMSGISSAVANTDLTLDASDPECRRRDVVIATGGSVAVLKGERALRPQQIPTPPLVPQGSVPLAVIDVPAGVTTITSAMILDRRITSIAPTLSGSPRKGFSFYRHGGSVGFTERWYTPGVFPGMNPSVITSTSLGGRQRVVPFVSGRGGTLDRVAMISNATGSNTYTFGIYRNIDAGTYPGSLFANLGVIDRSSGPTGIQTLTVSVALPPNELLWFSILELGAGALSVEMLQANANTYHPIFGIEQAQSWDLSAGIQPVSIAATGQTAQLDPFPSGWGSNFDGNSIYGSMRFSA